MAQAAALANTSSLTLVRSRSPVSVQFALIGFVALGELSDQAVTVGASGATVSISISGEQAESEILSATSIVLTLNE